MEEYYAIYLQDAGFFYSKNEKFVQSVFDAKRDKNEGIVSDSDTLELVDVSKVISIQKYPK